MRKSKWKFAAAGALALAVTQASAGQITLYEQSGFEGQTMTTTSERSNLLDRSAFDALAASVIVRDGTWEACTEPYFRGRCAQLVPGTYRKLGSELNGLVASVREVGYQPGATRLVINPDSLPVALNPVPAPVVLNPAPAPVVINSAPAPVVINSAPGPVAVLPPVVTAAPVPAGARVVLYQHIGGVVRAVELTSSVDNLDSRSFDDSADAALVSGGVWRLCNGEGGRGQCTSFSPGQYVSLGALDGKVRSAYLIAPAQDRVAAVAAVPTGRAVLYEFANFEGPTAVVERGPAPDLDWAHFAGPAASLRIESGSWLVCSDLGYQGDCRVLSPGNYPVLTGLLDHGIASTRQVWRPEYGALGPAALRDARRQPLATDSARYLP